MTEDVDALVKAWRSKGWARGAKPDELFALGDRLADALEALRRPGREEIARVIEPDAWTYFDLPQGDGDDWGKFDAWKRSSLRKADAILALFSPAPQQRGVV